MRAAIVGSLVVMTALACGGQPIGSASGARTATPSAHAASPAPTGVAGAISGRLGYPSEFLPGQAIYALSVDGKSFYKSESVSYQGRYTITGVPAGDYHVYAVARWGSSVQRLGAGYTKAIACGLSVDCIDHSPVTVHVDASKTTAGVDPIDWYAAPDEFPLIPDGATSSPSPAPTTFDSAEAAARSLGEDRLIGRYVANQADCGANRACFWFGSKVDGHDATYFIGYAGSNHDLIRCGFYAVKSGTLWLRLDLRCNDAESGIFPSLHEQVRVQLGMGETGCVRVHRAPGLSAPVVACLKEGTEVLIDGGPYYLPASTADNGPSAVDLWWHLAGRGWMVHKYLWSG